MELQVLALEAKELPLVHYDTNLLRQPSGRRPESPMVRCGDGCVDSKHRRDAVDGFAHLQVLVPLTAAAPPLRCSLSLNSHLENLRKGRLGGPAAPCRRLGRRIHQVVDLCGARTRSLAPTVHALDHDHGRCGKDSRHKLVRARRLWEVEERLLQPCRDWRDAPVFVVDPVEEESTQPLRHGCQRRHMRLFFQQPQRRGFRHVSHVNPLL